jgi:hypothetical protein
MRALCLVLMLIPTVVVLTEGQAKQVLNIFPGDTVQVAVTGLNATDTITVNLKAVSEQPATNQRGRTFQERFFLRNSA